MNKQLYNRFAIYTVLVLTMGCGKYLDVKPKSNMTTPTTLEDCQALLDDYSRMNAGYPSDGEASADNYYLTDANWGALWNLEDRERYIWEPQGVPALSQWLNPYRVVYSANLVLQTLEKIKLSGENAAEYNRIKGSALFFRAYAFYELAQLFASPFDANGNNHLMGIPLRLSPGIDFNSERANVGQTYDQIIADYKDAIDLLPSEVSIKSRPCKAAALACLARTFLAMGLYSDAISPASECLTMRPDLLDYNDIEVESQTPFTRFNTEVIFQSVTQPSGQLDPYLAIVDTNLLSTYTSMDLRWNHFFFANNDETYSFKGSYDGTRNGVLFTGPTTAEMYLTRAECNARLGNVEMSNDDLNILLEKRYRKEKFSPIRITDAAIMLDSVLAQRRKELVFRGSRWTDLRRLNKDVESSTTLVRNLNGKRYELSPMDTRYTLLLPKEVLENSKLDQNLR